MTIGPKETTPPRRAAAAIASCKFVPTGSHQRGDQLQSRSLRLDQTLRHHFIRHTRQVLGLHQLKLVTYRRNDALVPFLCLIDEVAIAMLHFLLDHATPAETMIGQLAIPFSS